MNSAYQRLAGLFRGLYFIAHNAHISAIGPISASDHALFRTIYEAADEMYDATLERSVGLGMPVDACEATKSAKAILDQMSSRPSKHLEDVKQSIRDCLAELQKVAPSATLGTNNLLAGFADTLEGFLYPITQRQG